MLGAKVHHVVPEGLVRHHGDVRAGVLVGGQALVTAGAGLRVDVELAGLQETQGLAVELTLHHRRHQHERPLDLALAGEVRVSAQHHVGFAGASAGGHHHALVGLHVLDGALLGGILAGHADAPELCGLARFEVATDVLHHAGDLALHDMARRVALVSPER